MNTSGICHLRSSAGLYGAEQMLLGLCAEQARRGARPLLTVFSPVGREVPALMAAAKARGIDVRALPCSGALDLGCIRALRARLIDLRRDGCRVLHCHDYKSVIYGRLASRGLGLWRVATAHGWLQGGRRLRLYHRLELHMLRGFDRVCAVSDAIADELRRAGLRAQRICRIDNGVDLERFQAMARPRKSTTVQLGSAARLSTEKNLAQLIRSLAECRLGGSDLRLTVYGEGPLRDALQTLIAELGMAHCVALPGVRGDLENWYTTLDAYVLVSLTEGMPLSVLEALACGCPVLASDVGSLPEMLADLPGCQIVHAGDGIALAAALRNITPHARPDPRLRQRVAGRYSLARMADAYAGVYRQALAA